jgi:hypothetical protein
MVEGKNSLPETNMNNRVLQKYFDSMNHADLSGDSQNKAF